MFILSFMQGASSIGITSDVSFYVSLHNKYLILNLEQQGMNKTIFESEE